MSDILTLTGWCVCGHHDASHTEEDVCSMEGCDCYYYKDVLREYVKIKALLDETINAMVIVSNGRPCYRTEWNIPQHMPGKVEAHIRKVIKSITPAG